MKDDAKPKPPARDARKTREPEFPELMRTRAQDRQHHVARAIEQGMSREEAERHADDHLDERRRDDGWD